MKRSRLLIIPLLLLLSVLLLSSCAVDYLKQLDAANAYLESKPYTLEIKTTYTCSDAAMEEALGDSLVTCVMDGKNMYIGSSTIVPVKYDNTTINVRVDYRVTLVDDQVYVMSLMTLYDQALSDRRWATVNKKQRQEVIDKFFGTSGASDFAEISTSQEEDRYSITFSGASDAYLEDLLEAAKSTISDEITDVTFGDVTLSLELLDGKYDKELMDYEFSFKLDGKEYTVGVSSESNYIYEADPVTKPVGSSAYKEVSYDELFEEG